MSSGETPTEGEVERVAELEREVSALENVAEQRRDRAKYAEAEVERLRAEVERLDAALEESQGDLDQLESDVGEYLPAYLLDEDDVANYRERVEYAGRDLKMLEAEVSQLRARLSALEDIDKVADYNIAMVGTLQEENEQLRARVAELEDKLKRATERGDRQKELREEAEETSYKRGARIASLESQLAASRAALRKYGRHLHDLAYRCGRVGGPDEACTCGLDAALHALPERPAAVGADDGGADE